MELRITRWTCTDEPTEPALQQKMESEGLSFYSWSNDPYDVYEAHSHSYDKVIYCVRGSITFGSPGQDRQITLHAGDRLELPAGTVHDAVVGSEGVVCLEAHL